MSYHLKFAAKPTAVCNGRVANRTEVYVTATNSTAAYALYVTPNAPVCSRLYNGTAIVQRLKFTKMRKIKVLIICAKM
jgi:hypothetical protein